MTVFPPVIITSHSYRKIQLIASQFGCLKCQIILNGGACWTDYDPLAAKEFHINWQYHQSKWQCMYNMGRSWCKCAANWTGRSCKSTKKCWSCIKKQPRKRTKTTEKEWWHRRTDGQISWHEDEAAQLAKRKGDLLKAMISQSNDTYLFSTHWKWLEKAKAYGVFKNPENREIYLSAYHGDQRICPDMVKKWNGH